jgi:L-ascorbate metabolism protein UlaG (beta-lactamase superfamily)
VELLGVRHVMPIHYGTMPALAGTPEALRAELDARGLDQVEIHAPEPGGTVA